MTVREIKDSLENYDDGAQVYIEAEIGDEIFLQKPIECIRFEEGAMSNLVIF